MPQFLQFFAKNLVKTLKHAQGEIRSFRIRLYSGFLTETQVSASGNLSNRCGKHLCMPRFRKCGLAETHSLNSRIRKFSETAELLLTAMFPLSVNSTDKKQSNKLRQRIKRTVGCFDMFGNIRFRKKLALSDREGGCLIPGKRNKLFRCADKGKALSSLCHHSGCVMNH